MATENLDCIYSLPAAADLSGNEGQPIVINTSGQVALAGANVVPHGHLHNPTANAVGVPARFVHHGKVVRAKAGGAITLGARLATHANGYAVATTGQNVVGIALKAVASGARFPALLIPGLPVAP